jgi:hypothetical protein
MKASLAASIAALGSADVSALVNASVYSSVAMRKASSCAGLTATDVSDIFDPFSGPAHSGYLIQILCINCYVNT